MDYFKNHFFYILHRCGREFHLVLAKLQSAPAEARWISGISAAFGVAFFLVGLARVTEFNGLGIPQLRKSMLIFLHLLGCVTFSLVFMLFGMDVNKTYPALNSLLAGLFVASIVLLFPVHIYVGLLRRIKYKNLNLQ
jgi:hypothetical protein